MADRCASSSSRETQVAAAARTLPLVVAPQQTARLAAIPAPTRMIGIASFYGSTAAALSESLDASAAVIGFRGHTLNPLLSPTRAFDLEQQVCMLGLHVARTR